MFLSLCFAVSLLTFHNFANAKPINSGHANNVCKERNSYVPVSGSCDLYLLCTDFKPSNEMCPDGLYFNSAKKYPDDPCSYPMEVTCKSQISQKPKSTDKCPRQNGIFPLSSDGKNDCKKYIECKEGTAKEMTCEAEKVFNPESFRCDDPASVPSCKDIVNDPVTTKPSEETPKEDKETTTVSDDVPNDTSEPVVPVTAPSVTTTTNSNPSTTESSEKSTDPQSESKEAISTTDDYEMIVIPTIPTPPPTEISPPKDESAATEPSPLEDTSAPTETSPPKDESASTESSPLEDTSAPTETSTSQDKLAPIEKPELSETPKTSPPSDTSPPKEATDANLPKNKPDETSKPSTVSPVRSATAVITYGSISMSDVKMTIPIKKK